MTHETSCRSARPGWFSWPPRRRRLSRSMAMPRLAEPVALAKAGAARGHSAWSRVTAPADHAPQGGHLPEELVPRLGRAADQGGARRHVRHHARLGAEPGSLPDADMPGDGRLPADLDEVLEHRRARDAHLRHDDAAPAEADVVPGSGRGYRGANPHRSPCRRSSPGRWWCWRRPPHRRPRPRVRGGGPTGSRPWCARSRSLPARCARPGRQTRAPTMAWLRAACAPMRQSGPITTLWPMAA